jgi:hypothetical protein
MRRYLYELLFRYLSIFVTRDDSIVEIEPLTLDLISRFPSGSSVARAGRPCADPAAASMDALAERKPDFVLLAGLLHYERDIQALLEEVRTRCTSATRVAFVYYSSVWKPFFRLAAALGLRLKQPEANWLAHEDVENLLRLSGFEPVRRHSAVLLPVRIPLLSEFVNRWIAPLPFFRSFNLANILVARPLGLGPPAGEAPSVSVVVPARNEAGNIDAIIARTPLMGPDDELIFVEGNSTDETWEMIRCAQEKYGGSRRIVIAQQEGRGKGDAVRKGFSLATKDILMILDADMTVPPEDLPRFYRALKDGAGEFVNGSRLVYPMEDKAMRFLNMLGNRFFAWAFSFTLGQRFKDTLCGTKVLTRESYLKLAARRKFFGDFDPFGDFDLLFGAARLCLKIVEVPITYRERTYGETNISRFTHGALLFRMLGIAARKLRFV